MHDGARGEEQKRLEESVRKRVIGRAKSCANTQAHEHVSQLANGAVREDAFEIILRHANGGGEDGG